MPKAKLPANEAERIAALSAYDILDTEAEEAFEDLTRLASHICGTPIALVSLVDSERQWFKSKVGIDSCETPRDLAFCAHAILQVDEVLVVEDATIDPRFSDNVLVSGDLGIRLYAGAPLVDPDGFPLGTLCVIDQKPRQLEEHQISALRSLARQVVNQLELRKSLAKTRILATELERTNEELKDFTNVAAHDLQEPLRKLVSFGRLLETDLGDDLPERAAKDLNFITSAALRMQNLVTDLLDLSRAGSAALRKEQFPLADCVQNAMEVLSLRIEETGATVTQDDLPTVTGDRTLLNQLFQNLISNALKFIKEDKPRIHVSCSIEDGCVVFGVKDNGIGIAPSDAAKIFAPFKRLHGRNEYEGTGIGLSIARKAVYRHGGRIWVDSNGDAGTHFKFTLAATDRTSINCKTPGEAPVASTT